jgi:hypothetical protein
MFRFFKYFIDHIYKIRDREVEEMHETLEKKIDHIHKKKKKLGSSRYIYRLKYKLLIILIIKNKYNYYNQLIDY